MTTKSYVKRFRLLIYPKFQLSLILGNFLVMTTIFISVYWYVYRAFYELKENGMQIGLKADHPYFSLIRYQSETILQGILMTFIIGMFISTLWMLLLSNKLAGPILRLRGYFEDIAKIGKGYPKVAFRKGDFFTELPPVINEALEKIESHKS